MVEFSIDWTGLPAGPNDRPREPENQRGPRTVEFEAVEEGTRLRVTHGTYGESEDEAKERAGHLAGWMAVLSRLRDLR